MKDEEIEEKVIGKWERKIDRKGVNNEGWRKLRKRLGGNGKER
jgi:hypothetical protein